MGAISRLHPPFTRLLTDPARRRRVLWLAAIGSLVFLLAQAPAAGEMDDRGAGIIAYELAGSSERADEIVTEWGPSGRSAARQSLVLDYPYLLSYGLFLAAACTAVGERFGRLGAPRLAVAGVALAWAAALGAGADAVENAALLVMTGEHTSQPWPGTAFGFAAVKFALTIPAFLYALIGWIATLVRGRARPAT